MLYLRRSVLDKNWTIASQCSAGRNTFQTFIPCYITDKVSLHVSASTAGIPCYCLYERNCIQYWIWNAKNQKETACPASPRCGFLFLQQCSTKKPNTQHLHAPFLPSFTALAVLGPVVLPLRGVMVSLGSSAFLRVTRGSNGWAPACCSLTAPGRCRTTSCTNSKQIRIGRWHLEDGKHKVASWPRLDLSASREKALLRVYTKSKYSEEYDHSSGVAGPKQKAASWKHRHCNQLGSVDASKGHFLESCGGTHFP